VLAGRVGKPHGLDGSFVVLDPVPALLTVGAKVVVGGRPTTITGRKGTDERPLVRVEIAPGRDRAEELRGEEIDAPGAAPRELEEDEYLAEDLVGCVVVAGGERVGVVTEMLALPSCEALVLDGSDVVVPLVRDAIRSIDVDAKLIDVNGGFLGLAT
jgi:16S rRNA processing protein RimM